MKWILLRRVFVIVYTLIFPLLIGCKKSGQSAKQKVLMLGEAYNQDCELTLGVNQCSTQNHLVEQDFLTAFASNSACSGIKLIKSEPLHDGKTKDGIEVDFPVAVYQRRDSWNWFSGDFKGEGATASDVTRQICRVVKGEGGEIVH